MVKGTLNIAFLFKFIFKFPQRYCNIRSVLHAIRRFRVQLCNRESVLYPSRIAPGQLLYPYDTSQRLLFSMLLLKKLFYGLTAGTVGVCITFPKLLDSPFGRDLKRFLFSFSKLPKIVVVCRIASSVLILSKLPAAHLFILVICKMAVDSFQSCDKRLCYQLGTLFISLHAKSANCMQLPIMVCKIVCRI